jgi:hypothetical protein
VIQGNCRPEGLVRNLGILLGCVWPWMRGANGDGDATDRWRGAGGCTMFEFAGGGVGAGISFT